MIVTALVLACLAGAVHVFIFYLESIAWTSKRARRIFGTGSAEEAEATQELAFNQGFYNLFLAIAVFAGTMTYTVGATAVGLTLVFTGTLSMAAAALVLMVSSPDKASAGLKQGAIPLLSAIVLTLGLILA